MSGPPRRWEALLGALLPARDRDPILGDLAEGWSERVRAGSPSAADRWYRRHVLRSLLPALGRRLSPGGRVDTSAPLRDARATLRSLAREPAFALTVLATLALGLGGATGVFSVVDAVLLRPLPFDDPGELHYLWGRKGTSQRWISAPDLADLTARLGAGPVAARSPHGFLVRSTDGTSATRGAEVSPGWFGLLGVPVVRGRGLAADDPPRQVAVISEGLWERRFGRDPSVLESALEVDGRAVRIVGVVHRDAEVLDGAEVWMPLDLEVPSWRTRRGIGWLQVLVRAPGGPDGPVGEKLAALSAVLREAHPDTHEGVSLELERVEEHLLGEVRAPLVLLLAAAGLVLLVVAVNVSGLLVARGVRRRLEMSVRAALGGGRGRLTAQLLTESAVLGLAGGILGIPVAMAVHRGLVGLAPDGIPRLQASAVGPREAFLALGSSLLTGLVVGLLPALRWGRSEPARAVVGAGRDARVPGSSVGRALVVVQVALAVVMASGAAVLVRSVQHLAAVDPGFRAEGVALAEVPLVERDFASPAERIRYLEGLRAAAGAVPGVSSAALTNAVPLRNGGPSFSYGLRDAAESDEEPLARLTVVSPDWFRVLGIDLVAGRTFSPEEAAGEVGAVIVDERLARRHFPPGEAVGREIEVADAWRRIVGVARPVVDRSLDAGPSVRLYVPVIPDVRQTMTLAVRAAGEPADLLPVLREAVRSVGPRQAFVDATTLTDVRDRTLARPRFTAAVMVAFGTGAALLSALGLYGLLSYVVGWRTREIGVRMALGASAAEVRARVIAGGMALAGLGLATGAAVAIALVPALEGLLFEVRARDPLSLGTAALSLALVAALASWLPAGRATRVSPLEALRDR